MFDIEKCKECYYADEDGVCEKSCLNNATFEPKRPNERIVEWISVKDRLPEGDMNVLVYVKEFLRPGIIETDCYKNNRFYYFRDVVTHWMPLPEPPKGE